MNSTTWAQQVINKKFIPISGGNSSSGSTLKSIHLYGQTFIGESESSTIRSYIGFLPINFNQDPADISLDNKSISENLDSLTLVGRFSTTDPDLNDQHLYSQISGDSSSDNDSFVIQGDSLLSNAKFDFETKNQYLVRIQTDDQHGGKFQKGFMINILDANDTPTDITLDNNKVAENSASGTLVGNLSSTDQDPMDIFTYSLVTGTGSDNNNLFIITGNELLTDTVFNFEAKNQYAVRIATTDSSGASFEKSFTINIQNKNDTPTDISLSNNQRPENDPIGYVIGDLSTTDEDTADSFVYTIVTGTGDTDNSYFGISSDQLTVAKILNYELKPDYSVRIQTDDQHGGTFSKSFTITVSDINDAPDSVTISNASITEGLAIGTQVGILHTIDQDDPLGIGTYIYNLVPGAGSDGNNSFSIQNNNQLISAVKFSLAQQSIYTIRVRSTDSGNLYGESVLTITINPAGTDTPPQDIYLSNNLFNDRDPIGSVIGTFTTQDPDQGDTHTYTLVSGTGDTDNGKFKIINDELQVNSTIQVSENDTLSIRVRSTDKAGAYIEKGFPIIDEPFVDNIKPVIGIPTYNTVYTKGSGNGEISVSVTDNDSVGEVNMFLKGLAAGSYSSQSPDVVSGNTYQFAFKETDLDSMGLEFYFTATDLFNNQIQSAKTYKIYLKYTDSNSPPIPLTRSGGKIEDYQIFSVPLDLNNKSIESIFEAKVGPYKKRKWRLVAWQNQKYVDYKEGLSQIELGKGYWFNSKSGVNIQTGAGTVYQDTVYSMSLEKEFTLIGNPYNVPISWNKVLKDNGNPKTVSQLRIYDPSTKKFKDGDILEPFSGGFVWSDESTKLNIYLQSDGTGSNLRTSNQGITSDGMNGKGWKVNLQLMKDEVKYNMGAFGMHPDASILKDQFDEMEVPRFINYLELYTTHKGYFYPWFSTDIVPEKDCYTWPFKLESNYVSGMVSLQWDNMMLNTSDQYYLLDKESGLLVDMHKTGSYRFNFTGTHDFEFYFVKGNGELPVPETLILGNAYPNPMERSTVIPVSLPSEKKEYDIDLSIYDLEGKPVKTIAKGEYKQGFYNFGWDRTNSGDKAGPGLYIYRLTIKDYKIKPLQKKLIIR